MEISKEAMLEGFCLLRQAERSLDHVLFDDWHELVYYYNGSRQELVREYLHQLTDSAHGINASDFNRDMFESRLKPLSWLFHLLMSLFSADKGCYYLMQDEVSFIASTLNAMLSFLSGDRPSDADIIQLRMDASLCQDLILMRCGTLPQLEKANMVENFDMPEQKQHYAVEEIIRI